MANASPNWGTSKYAILLPRRQAFMRAGSIGIAVLTSVRHMSVVTPVNGPTPARAVANASLNGAMSGPTELCTSKQSRSYASLRAAGSNLHN